MPQPSPAVSCQSLRRRIDRQRVGTRREHSWQYYREHTAKVIRRQIPSDDPLVLRSQGDEYPD